MRILLPGDLESVMAFARQKLTETMPDTMEMEMHSWLARWRAESLAYYLPQGWSFGMFSQGNILGFSLGQPLLFFRGLTQTLWIEELIYTSDEVGRELLENSFRWARDKHLQCVLVESTAPRIHLVENWKQAHQLEEPMIEIRSQRF